MRVQGVGRVRYRLTRHLRAAKRVRLARTFRPLHPASRNREGGNHQGCVASHPGQPKCCERGCMAPMVVPQTGLHERIARAAAE